MQLTGGEMLGAYRLIERVGRGGMAEVWRAYQPSLSRFVAIKVLPRFLAADPAYEARFKREARLVSRLRHPNILTGIDFGQQDGHAYMVSEYVEGGTLADQAGQPLPLDYVVGVLRPVANALDYAHARGIVHRDVKPSNVLLQSDGTPVLADFGVAAVLHGDARLTGEGVAVGTPIYMSPEQVAGQQAAPASDQYSLGVVAYELLTGRPPFAAETPAAVALAHLHKPLPPPGSINPRLPLAVEGVLLKALAKEPAERYATVREMAEALASAAAAATTAPTVGLPAVGATSEPQTAVRLADERSRRGRGLVAVGLALGLVGLLVGPSLLSGAAERPPAARPAETSAPATAEPMVSGVEPTVPVVEPASKRTGGPAQPSAASPAPGPSPAPRSEPELRLTTVVALRGHADAVWDLAFAPDGGRLVSTSHQEPRLIVWELPSGREAIRFGGHQAAVVAAAWSPGQFPDLVASGSFQGEIRLWDAARGNETAPPLTGHSGPIWSLAWDRSGRHLASGADDGTVRVWTPGSGQPGEVIQTGHGAAYAMAWSPAQEGQRLLAGGLRDGAIAIWDAPTGRLRTSVEGHAGPVQALAWSPDGRLLASGAEDGTLRVWSARPERSQPLPSHRGAVWTVAWSCDGSLLASGAEDGLVRVWRLLSGRWELAAELPARGGPVFALAWSRDRATDLLAVGRQDGQVELVQVAPAASSR